MAFKSPQKVRRSAKSAQLAKKSAQKYHFGQKWPFPDYFPCIDPILGPKKANCVNAHKIAIFGRFDSEFFWTPKNQVRNFFCPFDSKVSEGKIRTRKTGSKPVAKMALGTGNRSLLVTPHEVHQNGAPRPGPRDRRDPENNNEICQDDTKIVSWT